MLQYPDEEDILLHALERWGETSLIETEKIYESDVSADVVDIRVASVDSETVYPFRAATVTIVVGARGRNECKRISEEILQFLTSGPVATERGLIDRVTVNMSPRLLPQAVDLKVFFQADYTVYTRARF